MDATDAITKLLNKDKTKFNKECIGFDYVPLIIGKRRRVIAIGDVHGDYNFTLQTLKLAKVISDDSTDNHNVKWIGDDTVVVQVGDQIDRCRPYDGKCQDEEQTYKDEHSDLKILVLFTELHKQAVKFNGLVISLLGNHELMNVDGNMNYVSYKGLVNFDSDSEKISNKSLKQGLKDRVEAFQRGAVWSKYLACTRLSFVVIGSFIFVHGGILPETLQKTNVKSRDDLININRTVRQWLLDKGKTVDKIYLNDPESIFWDRILGQIPPNVDMSYDKCKMYLKPTLQLLNLEHMVVGHTPQSFTHNKMINGTCDNKLFRIDSGGSQAFEKYPSKDITDIRGAQVLEILNDGETVNVIGPNKTITLKSILV